jgi:branched-chain amino acid transport system permease protein
MTVTDDGARGDHATSLSRLRQALTALPKRVVPQARLPLLVVASAAIGWPVLARLLPNGLPAGIVLLGVVLGSLTGLTAIGIVLVYRASRIVNFAQASLGSAVGVLSVLVFTTWHWNYFLAFGLGLAIATLTGCAIERLVVRRFFWAPLLILTLATIGIAQILGGVELILPTLFGQPLVTNSFKTPLSGTFTVRPVLFTGSHLLIVLIVPVVVAALVWFLRATSAGKGIRASAENAERAMLLGIPVRRLSMIVWAIAAVLSALAIMLTAPIQPLPPTVLSGPVILLPSLAAAVLARMESLPRAFIAGIGIGILQQATFWSTSRSSSTDVAFLVVILVALLLQRDRLSRADDASASSWVAAQETPPIPLELRGLPEVIWGRRALLALVALTALLAPMFLSVSQVDLLGTVAVIYAVIGVSLVILTGWAGQLSLGQFAIAGAGAVVAVNLLDHNVDLLLVLPASAVAGAAAALLIGVPALRIRGLFLGVTTLALTVAMSTYFLNPSYFSSILPRTIDRPVVFGRFHLADERTLYYFALAVLVVVLFAARNLRASQVGRRLIAVRDNERAAQARGIHALRVKLLAFTASGAVAGIAGALLVLVLQGVGSGDYSPQQSFEVFSMVVIGGLTSLPGAVIGAVFLRTAQYVIGGGLQLVVTGTGVLLLLLVFPGGLGQVLYRARDAALRRIAERRGLIVPSLIADRRRLTAEPERSIDLERLLHADVGVANGLAASHGSNGGVTRYQSDEDEVVRLRREAEELRQRLDELEHVVDGIAKQ